METKTITMTKGRELAHVYQRPSRRHSSHAAIGVEVYNPSVGGYMTVLQTLLPQADRLGVFWEFNRMLCKAAQDGFEIEDRHFCKYESQEAVE